MKKISLGKLNIVYTEKSDGNMRLPENRKKVLSHFGFSSVFIPDQKHTSNVFDIEDYKGEEADGLFTDKKNTPIGVLTADCMPVVISDGEVLLVLHAGWKGLFNGIIENGIENLKNRERGFAVIGASARDCCYYVGEDFLEKAKEKGINITKRHFKKDEKGIKFSLQEVAKDKLKEKGINHIVDLSLCTICKENFFSYRKGDFEDRMLTFAWLSED